MVESRSESVRTRGEGVDDQTEAQLREWVRTVDPSADVSLEPPGVERPGRGVGVYLLDIAPRPAPRGADRPPLQLWLRYLVTVWAEDPADAHRLLLDLVFDALSRDDLEVDVEALPTATWAALQAVPQPSFFVRVPVRRERPEPITKPVLIPLRLEAGRLAVVAGVVRDTRDQPVSAAIVEIPGLDRATQTDNRGRFQLTAVPGPPAATQLRVRAKRGEVVVPIPGEPDLARSMVIQIDPLGREHGRHPDA